MTNTLLRAGALSCALLATTCLTVPAQAQTARAHRSLDANGVDLTHGDFLMSVVEGSIGSGDSELALVRTRIGSGSGAEHTSSGGHQWDGIHLMQFPQFGGGVVTSIVKDARFENFHPTGALPSGSTLTQIGLDYHYGTADGTTIVFSDPSGQMVDTSTYCNGNSAYCILLPSSITEPNGKTVTLAWEVWSSCEDRQSYEDPFVCSYWARIGSVSNSFGYRIAFNYASQGNGPGGVPPNSWARRTGATFHNDAAGGAAQASVSYSYPSTGVVDVTDTGGRVWRFTGNSAQISGIRRPGATSDTTSVAYTGNQVSSITRDGVTTGYSRSVSGNTATMTITDALSQQANVVSDLTVGRPTSVTDPLGRTTSFQYDGNARLTRVTQPEGNYVQYTLDGRGNVTQTQAVAKSGSGLAAITASASFDASCANPVTCNQPNSVTDARGNTTDYTYDSTHGGVLTVTDPAMPNGIRPQTRYSYTLLNGEHRLTGVSACQTLASCAGTADEVKTVIGYDANGNVTSTSSGNGSGTLTATATSTYDALGNLLTVDGPLSGSADTIRMRYNAVRAVVGTISPDPDGAGALKHRAARTTIDATTGLLIKTEAGTVNSQSDADWAAFAPLEAVEIGYDINARPVTQKLVAGGTAYALTQASYDALGRVECNAQRMNSAAFTSLPSSACTLGTQGSFGPDRISKTIYDAAGQVTKVQSAYGTIDQADEATYSYLPNGNREYITDANGNRARLAYDGHDRQEYWFFPNKHVPGVESLIDYEQLTYDAASNVISRRVRDGQTIGYGYDALNRLTSKDLPNSLPFEADTSYAYDNLGRLTQANDSLSLNTYFTYDALGRKLSEGNNHHGATTYQYDLAGRRTRMTWKDGFFVDYDYLTTGEMTTIRENGATSGVGVLATFAYDDLGRRASLTRGNGLATLYTHDPVSRLATYSENFPGDTFDQQVTFAYNPASQITNRTGTSDIYAWIGHGSGSTASTANGLNQLAGVGGVTPTYDAKGNMTSDGVRTFGYTAENILHTVNGGAALAHDALGRLYYTSDPISFAYDGSNMIAELQYVGGHPIVRRYVHGPGVDEPLVWYEGSGTIDRRFLHADERGSIVMASLSDGTPWHLNRYDEYGVPASNHLGRFGYTGQAWLPELGLYYYKARMYHPKLGRFMQTDPIGYEAGTNLYNYVGSDPVNFTDPEGLLERGFTLFKKRYVAVGGTTGGGNRDGGGLVKISTPVHAVGDTIVVTAARYEWVSSGLPFYFDGTRYVSNPYYEKPWYSNSVDAATGVLFAGPMLIIAGAEAAGAVIPVASLSGPEVGAIVGWGGGRTAVADAIARTAQITPRAVAQMRAQGLTRPMAIYWRNLYTKAAATGRGGATAPARSALMDAILKNW